LIMWRRLLRISLAKEGGQEEEFVAHGAKAFEKIRFRPMYAGANMGHPSRTRTVVNGLTVGNFKDRAAY
jgi:hypothetical protein